MSARITPLRLEAFEQLPKHARRCVFWEVDPATLGDQDHLADPEFEKEAWLSMVMLEWGTCGQVATVRRRSAASVSRRAWDNPLRAAASGAAGARFPTAPVSADAVLLTSMGSSPATSRRGLAARPHRSRDRRVGPPRRPGAGSLRPHTGNCRIAGSAGGGPEVPAGAGGLGDCSVEHCIIDADFLKDAGFVVVAPHRYFPRLRLELDKGLGWKAEVEAALERLLSNAQLQQPVGAGSVSVLRDRKYGEER